MSITSDFVKAGKAIFTIEPAQGYIDANAAREVEVKPHYTYRVSHKEASEKYGEAWFVSLLSGPDNESNYTYLGMLDAQTGQVRLTARSNYAPDSQPVRIVQRVLARVWAGDLASVEGAGWKVHHEGRCGRCGRLLTVPESIESGIGPECAKRMAG